MDYIILFLLIAFLIFTLHKNDDESNIEHFDFIETPANPLWWWKSANTIIYKTVDMGCQINNKIGSGLKKIGLMFDV